MQSAAIRFPTTATQIHSLSAKILNEGVQGVIAFVKSFCENLCKTCVNERQFVPVENDAHGPRVLQGICLRYLSLARIACLSAYALLEHM